MKESEYEEYLISRTFEFFKRYEYSNQYAYKIDFSNPITYTEKMQWLKLYDQSEKKTKYTDKYEVRKHISLVLGEKYLIPLISINGIDCFENVKQINFDALPNQFVLKCTHGSHMNIIVKDKSRLSNKDIRGIKRKLNDWLNTNYAFVVSCELQYKDIKPRIIIEKYMDDGQPTLCDYKVFCYSGVPKFISINQFRGTEKYCESYFDLDFKPLPYTLGNHLVNPDIQRPQQLSKLIEFSRLLAEDFAHIRVDFYIINGNIYFGELTFSPGAGYDFPNPMLYDKELGELVTVDKSKRKDNFRYRKH